MAQLAAEHEEANEEVEMKRTRKSRTALEKLGVQRSTRIALEDYATVQLLYLLLAPFRA